MSRSQPDVTLEPGLHGEREFEVDDRLVTDVGGTLAAPVLSTPGMIAMMERTAAMLVFPHLTEGRATVGFEVCVKHVGSATRGARCTARATLREVVDGRKLFFDVDVVDGDRVIGVGTHQRRIVGVDGAWPRDLAFVDSAHRRTPRAGGPAAREACSGHPAGAAA